MNKSALLILLSIFWMLAACDAPNIKGLNSMPEKTDAMSRKMDATNEAIHKQTLLAAWTEMNKPENQKNIFPVPTGLMPSGKVFAEEARADELVELTYNELKKLEENTPVMGLDKDGVPLPLTDSDMAIARLQKMANFYGLMVIAAFAQDEKIDQILQHDILGHGRYQEAALSFLAMREFFLREVLLKLSLDIDKDSPVNLDSSGKMNEALKYLIELDKISKLDLHPGIKYKPKGEAEFLAATFDEDSVQKRPETAAMWAEAVEKAVAGSKAFATNASGQSGVDAEMNAQFQAIEKMKAYLATWQK